MFRINQETTAAGKKSRGRSKAELKFWGKTVASPSADFRALRETMPEEKNGDYNETEKMVICGDSISITEFSGYEAGLQAHLCFECICNHSASAPACPPYARKTA